MTLREIVAMLEKAAGCTLRIDWGARPYRPREVMRLWDGSAMPGWQPRITLADGFKALLQEIAIGEKLNRWELVLPRSCREVR